MQTIQVHGGVIEFSEHGEGRPLVLLHSLLTDSSAFDYVVPELARNHRVIAPNLPGFGHSSPAGSDVEHVADRLAAFFDALELTAGIDVLGNGYGGFVAGMLAIRHGTRFDRLVLANTGAAFSDAAKGAFFTMATRVREQGMSGVVDIAISRLFPTDYIDANRSIVEERRRVLLGNDPQRFAQACLSLAALDLREQIKEVRNATLVLVGSADTATPVAMSQELASLIPGAQYVELPGCAHAPMIQAPAAFIAALKPFLNGAEVSPSGG